MKKANLLIGIAIVAAIGVAAYLFMGKKGGVPEIAPSGVAEDAVAHFVPDDTVLFFGGLVPLQVADFVKPFQNMLKLQAEMLAKMPVEEDSPAVKFGMAFFSEYLKSLSLPEPLSDFGLGKTVNSGFYMVGGLPVMRVGLNDSDAFKKKIDAVTQQSNVTPLEKQQNGLVYRVYELESGTGKGIAVAQVSKWAVITLDFGEEKYNSFLSLALGQTKPEKTLADSGKLQTLVQKYRFDPRMVGFVDHVGIVNALYAGDSRLGQTIKLLEESDPDIKRQLKEIREGGCKEDVTRIAGNWPRTVMGYTNINFSGTPKKFDSSIIAEVTDTALLAALKKLRGYIPEHVNKIQEKMLLGIGVGLDVDQLMPFLSQLSGDIQKQRYTCPPLQEMQRNFGGPGLMGFGMAAGMVAGLKGISVSVLDLEVSGDPGMMPDIQKLDALITVSAANPKQLLSAAQNIPNIQVPQIPEDGTPVDFPMPVPMLNEPVKLAMKGSHIVAYTGQQSTALANAIAGDKINQNGMLAVGVDYPKYLKILSQSFGEMMALSGTSPEMIEALSESKMQIVERVDVTDNGIEFHIDAFFQ